MKPTYTSFCCCAMQSCPVIFPSSLKHEPMCLRRKTFNLFLPNAIFAAPDHFLILTPCGNHYHCARVPLGPLGLPVLWLGSRSAVRRSPSSTHDVHPSRSLLELRSSRCPNLYALCSGGVAPLSLVDRYERVVGGQRLYLHLLV